MKKIVVVVLGWIILSIIPEMSLKAEGAFNGISEADYSKVEEYLKSEVMINRMEWALQKEVDANEIDCSGMIKVNVLPYRFVDSYDQDRSIKEMYGSMWQYKIPMLVNGEKLVVTLSINSDGSFKYVGMSYGEENKVFFINKDDVIAELESIGISTDDINYSDFLYSNSLNMLFIHFCVCEEDDYGTTELNKRQNDYLIPYTTTDFESEYTGDPKVKFENGIIKPAVEIANLLADTSFFHKDEADESRDGSLNAGYQLIKADNNHETEESMEDNEMTQLAPSDAGNKMVVGGLLMMSATLMLIWGCKMKKII